MDIRNRLHKSSGYGITLLFLIFVSALASPRIGSAGAQYFPPVPPPDIVVDETHLIVSLTKPSASVFVNVSDYNPTHFIHGMRLNFSEPIGYVEITIYVLNSIPPEAKPLDGVVVLYYFTIRALSKLGESVETVTLNIAVKKTLITELKVDERTIAVYRYYEGEWRQYLASKVGEDAGYLYLQSHINGLSHFAVAGILLTPAPTALSIGLVIVVLLLLVIGAYVYASRKPSRTNQPLFGVTQSY